MKYSQWQRAVVGRREASAQRSARAVPRLGAEVGYASLGVPLPCFLPFLHFVAQSADRETTGSHRRNSLAKIGAEGEEILRRDDDSGAECIVRTLLHAVIAGLDPAIHAAVQHGP